MDAVRRRLAPIRGIPTKSGKMADPNADIKEVFDLIEEIPKAPAKVLDNIKRWVSWGGGASVCGWVRGRGEGGRMCTADALGALMQACGTDVLAQTAGIAEHTIQQHG